VNYTTWKLIEYLLLQDLSSFVSLLNTQA